MVNDNKMSFVLAISNTFFIWLLRWAVSQRGERVAGGPTSEAGEHEENPPARRQLAQLCCLSMTVSIKRKDNRLIDQRHRQRGKFIDKRPIWPFRRLLAVV